MLRFDAEPPAESARRQGIRPCTAQNLRLPPTTVETKIRPAGLLARLRTNELSTAHGIPCPGFRPGSLANRGLPVPCREINLLQPPTADIECCDSFRSLKQTRRPWPGWNTTAPGVEDCLFPTGMRLKARKPPGLWTVCQQQGTNTAGGSTHYCRTGLAGDECEGCQGLSGRITTIHHERRVCKCRW